MDPASTISLVGTCLRLCQTTIGSIKATCEIKEAYDRAPTSINGLLSKVNAIVFCLVELETWVQRVEEDYTTADSERSLLHHLREIAKSCTVVIEGIRAKVPDLVRRARRRERLRFLWNEDTLKSYQQDLDSQINALRLLLETSRFRGEDQQRKNLENQRSKTILDSAKDVALVYKFDPSSAWSSSTESRNRSTHREQPMPVPAEGATPNVQPPDDTGHEDLYPYLKNISFRVLLVLAYYCVRWSHLADECSTSCLGGVSMKGSKECSGLVWPFKGSCENDYTKLGLKSCPSACRVGVVAALVSAILSVITGVLIESWFLYMYKISFDQPHTFVVSLVLGRVLSKAWMTVIIWLEIGF
jgi:hypothetical protein